MPIFNEIMQELYKVSKPAGEDTEIITLNEVDTELDFLMEVGKKILEFGKSNFSTEIKSPGLVSVTYIINYKRENK